MVETPDHDRPTPSGLLLRPAHDPPRGRAGAGLVLPLPRLPAADRRGVRLECLLQARPARRGRGRVPHLAARRRQRPIPGFPLLPDLRLDRLLGGRGHARLRDRRDRRLCRSILPGPGAHGLGREQARLVAVPGLDPTSSEGPDVSDYYRTHGALTEPGRFASTLAAPADLAALCTFIQGVVIHSDWASAYGVTADLSRETLPVARRLAMVEAAGGRDLPPERRTPGTCRDFALMTCSALRERGVVARVRCGFATYFTANPFEDHWVCEHWREDERRWVLTDAQLDPLQRDHLCVTFDPTDLPAKTFL